MRTAAQFAIGFVRNTNADAELCLCDDEWRIETETGDERTFMGVQVVNVSTKHHARPMMAVGE